MDESDSCELNLSRSDQGYASQIPRSVCLARVQVHGHGHGRRVFLLLQCHLVRTVPDTYGSSWSTDVSAALDNLVIHAYKSLMTDVKTIKKAASPTFAFFFKTTIYAKKTA